MYELFNQKMDNKVFCSGALIVKDGRFLLGKRADGDSTYAGLWDIIGGHNEDEETPEQTLRRELREELGIEPLDQQLFFEVMVDDLEHISPYPFYIYLVTSWNGEISNCSDEHTEIRWFSKTELNAIELSSSNYKTLFAKWESLESKPRF